MAILELNKQEIEVVSGGISASVSVDLGLGSILGTVFGAIGTVTGLVGGILGTVTGLAGGILGTVTGLVGGLLSGVSVSIKL